MAKLYMIGCTGPLGTDMIYQKEGMPAAWYDLEDVKEELRTEFEGTLAADGMSLMTSQHARIFIFDVDTDDAIQTTMH